MQQAQQIIVALTWLVGGLLLILAFVLRRGLPKSAKIAIALIVPVATGVILYSMGIKMDITLISIPLIAGLSLAIIYTIVG